MVLNCYKRYTTYMFIFPDFQNLKDIETWHFLVSFRTAAGQMRSNWFCLLQNAFTQWKWRAFAEWALGYVPRKYDVRHQQGAGLERLLSRFASVCHGFWCWFMFTLWWRLDCWLIHAYLLWRARRPFGAHKVQVILDPPGRSSTQTTFPAQDGTDGNGWKRVDSDDDSMIDDVQSACAMLPCSGEGENFDAKQIHQHSQQLLHFLRQFLDLKCS